MHHPIIRFKAGLIFFLALLLAKPSLGQVHLFVSENDCNNCIVGFNNLLKDKPYATRLYVYSDIKSKFFLNDVLETSFDIKYPVSNLEKTDVFVKKPVLTTLSNRIINLNADNIQDSAKYFVWPGEIQLQLLKFPFGNRTELKCGATTCAISSYRNKRVAVLKIDSTGFPVASTIVKVSQKRDTSMSRALAYVGMGEWEPLSIINPDRHEFLYKRHFIRMRHDTTIVDQQICLVSDALVSKVEDAVEDSVDLVLNKRKGSDLSHYYTIPKNIQAGSYSIIGETSILTFGKEKAAIISLHSSTTIGEVVTKNISYLTLLSTSKKDFLVTSNLGYVDIYKIHAKGYEHWAHLTFTKDRKVVAADITAQGALVILTDQNEIGSFKF